MNHTNASTAPDTKKFALTPAYAGPERWRAERATSSTDVYSFGVMAHEMLAGTLPFPGPTPEDYREQHLHESAPALMGVPPLLAGLVESCLYKASGSRPSPADVLDRLRRAGDAAPSPGLTRLQEVGRAQAAQQAEQARRQSQAQSDDDRRKELFDSARKEYARISASLKEALLAAAPSVQLVEDRTGSWYMQLGRAQLRMSVSRETPQDPWAGRTAPAFEVVAHATLEIKIPRDRYDYEGRSHSLWYCDAQEAGRYQWFETAFMYGAFTGRQFAQVPHALDPSANAARALSSGLNEFRVAWRFTPVPADDLEAFISRWAEWFAAAGTGDLNLPSTLPEHETQSSWRRS